MTRFLMTMALLMICAQAALAHHNKGLPHYGYFENYPQVPTKERISVDAGWEFGATIFNFQGLQRETSDTPNDVKIYVYLYDLKADKPYLGPVVFEIHYGDELVTTFERKKADEEAIYITRETLPQSGDYELHALVPGVDRPLRVGFAIDLADDTNWALIFALGFPVALVFILAILGRTRRGQTKLSKSQAAR